MRKLKLLFAVAALMASGLTASAYQTPTADGIYYLYNTACTDGTPGFMSTGNNYGFQVVIDNFGFPVKLISTGTENTYQFQFIHHNGYLSDDGFMYSDGDTNRARTITVQDQGNGNYKLLNTNNSKEIEDWYGNVVGDGTGNRHNYIWQFLSKDERNAMIAGYTKDQKMAAATSMGITLSEQTSAAFDAYITENYIGIDQSSKIQNGTFDTSHNITGWTTTHNDNRTFNIGWGNADPKTTPEVYEGAGSITQTVTVDKAGLYKVSVNATYRCGNNDNNNRIGDLGYDGSVAYLKANNNFTKIDDWYSGKINGNGPGSPSEANSAYFANGKYLTEVFVYVDDTKTIEISLHSHAFTWGGWFMFNNFKLTYYSNEVSEEDATAILNQATELLEQEMDAIIKSNLTSAKNAFDSARTIANYNALATAITAAQESVEAYALFAAERTKALALGMTAEDVAAFTPDVHALMVAEYNYVKTNYSYGVELGTWTTENATDRSGQHWDNTSTSTYSEQNEGWGSERWSCSYSQDLTLPAGNYVFKVAGRKSSDQATITLAVKNGENLIGTVNDFPNGDTGLGINTSGDTDFTTGEGHSYANGGVGRGWQWRYVKFTLDEPATVKVSVEAGATAINQWVGFCNATVQTDNADNVALMEALVALNSAKTAATLTKFTNVGTGVFQCDETINNTLWSAYETAKNNANDYTLTASSKVTEVNGLVEALNTAISNYQNQALNAPDASKHYNIIVATADHSKNGNAIVLDRVAEYPVTSNNYVTNNTGFTLNASAKPNANLAQACVFTPVDGKVNTYYISMEREEGTVYLTYGTLNDSKVNWKDSQIQATTDAQKKGEFKVAATTTANAFNIYNTLTNSTIACQNGGNIYTEAGNADFSVVEASQATVNLNIAEGVKYATRIFPFAPELPTGVVAYACEASTAKSLTLTEVAEPKADTPYILIAENGCASTDLSGWGVAAAETKTVGYLTGVYTRQPAPVGSYVLQNNDGKVAFYVVAEGGQPTVGAYRVYVTVPVSGVRSLDLDGEETGIAAIEALTSGNAEIFNTSGAQVPTLQKGVNIIRKADGTTYKIMVK